MTNKPPPDSASAYVESTLLPLREFLSTYEPIREELGASWQQTWEEEIIEAVTACYCEQVRLLMETVRQMDSALLRRSKMRTTSASGDKMTDSTKISLQLSLDVEAYGVQIQIDFGFDPLRLPSYVELKEMIAVSEEQK
jgi:hypothetical protein